VLNISLAIPYDYESERFQKRKATAMKNKLFISIQALFLCLCLMDFAPQAQEYDWAAIDEEDFESFQPTGHIMDVIGIRPGMKVGEVGAGGGRVCVRVARRIGPAGRVYGNDITASALEYMRNRIKREEITNMEVVEGTLTDPRFPKGSLDVVFLTNTYRHLEEPVEILKNIARALNPTGKLGIVESKRYARNAEANEIVENAALAGFELIQLDKSLPRDDIYVFEIKRASDSGRRT
jgi:SAM-dependent methyltransferase